VLGKQVRQPHLITVIVAAAVKRAPGGSGTRVMYPATAWVS
jgi:hypothetical protein